MKNLLLFDIDGTLINGGGAGRRALDRACLELFDLDNACGQTRLDGKTDRLIVREIFHAHAAQLKNDQNGGHEVEHFIDTTLKRYIELLAVELQNSPAYRILPGIEETLLILQRSDDFLVGLATGNIRAGAELKLNHGKLFSYFSCGGFGCDSEIRSELVQCAIERAGQKLGEKLASNMIYVIGDTPYDIEAGRRIGVNTVAVATGSFSMHNLASCKPTHLFENFSDSKKFLSIFD